jgi:hypothetical protein
MSTNVSDNLKRCRPFQCRWCGRRFAAKNGNHEAWCKKNPEGRMRREKLRSLWR